MFELTIWHERPKGSPAVYTVTAPDTKGTARRIALARKLSGKLGTRLSIFVRPVTL